MQINYIDDEQLADLLTEALVLDTLDDKGLRIHVLEYTGQDILAIHTPNGGGAIVYPCASFDAESGGSIHDHARAARRRD